MTTEYDLRINVEGADKSGKGHLIALIAHYLEELGCHVVVQGSEGHNKAKLAKDKIELLNRIQNSTVCITGMQTNK